MPFTGGGGSSGSTGFGRAQYGTATSTLTDGSLSLDGTTTIEWITSANARENTYLECGDYPNNTQLWYNAQQGVVAGYLMLECGDFKDIVLVTVQSAAGGITNTNITYYPYSLKTAMSATNTPYTEIIQNIGGQTFRYDPLKAQTGIILYIAVFILVIWGFIKIFRKA